MSAQVLEQVMQPPRSSRPVAFWFLNHRLEDEELRQQIRQMAQQGMGGFMLHARDGLRTGYLREDWAHAVEVCIEEARQLGLEVWLYDENHYPSGPAGDLLQCRFPDRTMKSLALVQERYFKAAQVLTLEIPQKSFFTLAGWGTRLTRVEVQLPQGAQMMVLAAGLRDGQVRDYSEQVREGALCTSAAFADQDYYVCVLAVVPFRGINRYQYAYYPDCFDDELTEEFLDLTHRWYAKRFGQHFGRTVKGIFGDNNSPSFGYLRRSVPWGKDFEQRFRRETGRDLRPLLPGLFCAALAHARADRLFYWRFVGQAYLKSYYGRIKDYCSSVNLLSTGHLCLEDGMAEHTRQIGDYFEVMRSFSMPAVDQLGPRDKGASLAGGVSDGENLTGCIKNTASAALWNGSPRVMCESFGCAGAPWRLDLAEIRRIGNWLFGLGADLFVPHGLYYSIAGHRKWECTPDHLHNPLWKYYHLWTTEAGRLSAANENGVPVSQIGVLYPVHALRAALEAGAALPLPASASAAEAVEATTAKRRSGWLIDCSAAHPQQWDHGAEADCIQRTFRWVLNALLAEHVPYEVLDETTLARCCVCGDALQVPLPGREDALRLKTLILPAMTVIEPATQRLLEDFLRAGGEVLCLNALPGQVFEPVCGTLSDIGGLWGDLLAQAVEEKSSTSDLPPLRVLADSVANGLRLLACVGNPVDENIDGYVSLRNLLRSDLDVPVCLKSAKEWITRSWCKAGMRFHFIANGSAAAASAQVRIQARRPCVRLTPQTGEVLPLPNPECWTVELRSGESVLVIEGAPADVGLSSARSGKAVAAGMTQALAEGIHRLEGSWRIAADRPNVLPLRDWATTTPGKHQIHRLVFRSALELPQARLLLDLERSIPELDVLAYTAGRVRCTLNGAPVTDFRPGTYLDRNIYEAEVGGLIRRGDNELLIDCESHLLDWEYRLCPPMLVGDFSVRADEIGWCLHEPMRELMCGDWTAHGFAFFSGEISYTKTVQLPQDNGRELWLEFNAAGAVGAEVLVDNQVTGQVTGEPWRIELTRFAGRHVELTIRIANTPHNLFTQEGIPSGLLAPVVLYHY